MWTRQIQRSYNCDLERFSNECLKTKTKVITLTNHSRKKNQNEPLTNWSKFKSLALSAGKRVRASHDWFLVLLLIGRESGANFYHQLESEVKQNQSKTTLLSTLIWKPLYFNKSSVIFFRLMSKELETKRAKITADSDGNIGKIKTSGSTNISHSKRWMTNNIEKRQMVDNFHSTHGDREI